jgi:hypothetical protein
MPTLSMSALGVKRTSQTFGYADSALYTDAFDSSVCRMISGTVFPAFRNFFTFCGPPTRCSRSCRTACREQCAAVCARYRDGDR